MKGMSKKRIMELVSELNSEQFIKKNALHEPWISGSSTEVYPITVWVELGEVDIQMIGRGKPRGTGEFINRIVEKYNDVLEDGAFCKMDGSCPNVIRFYFKDWLDIRLNGIKLIDEGEVV